MKNKPSDLQSASNRISGLRSFFFLLSLLLLASPSFAVEPQLVALTRGQCPLLAARIMNAPDKTPTQQLIQQQMRGLSPANRPRWIQENMTPPLLRAIDEKLNIHDLMKGKGLASNERVFWMQQSGIKELNESLWNMGGTEFFLRTLDEELALVLKQNPSYGRVVNSNFKDRVVISSLSPREFNERVMNAVYRRVAQRVAHAHTRSGASSVEDWYHFLRGRAHLGNGRSLTDAHLARLGLGTPETYKNHIDKLLAYETYLSGQLKKARNTSFDELFAAMKVAKDDPARISTWLVDRGVDPRDTNRIIDAALKYKSDLNVADILPITKPPNPTELAWALEVRQRLARGGSLTDADRPMVEAFLRETWTGQQADFFSHLVKRADDAASVDAGAIIAADFKGLGLRGLKARREWLLAGADPSKIAGLLDDVNDAMVTRVAEVQVRIRQLAGNNRNIHFYQTGDDLLISLPRISLNGAPDITNEQYMAINRYLLGQTDLYSAARRIEKPGDAMSIATAVDGARETLFSSKPGAARPK